MSPKTIHSAFFHHAPLRKKRSGIDKTRMAKNDDVPEQVDPIVAIKPLDVTSNTWFAESVSMSGTFAIPETSFTKKVVIAISGSAKRACPCTRSVGHASSAKSAGGAAFFNE